MQYTYFVSFTYKTADGEREFGNFIFYLPTAIKGKEEIKLITDEIAKCHEDKHSITILNFQLIGKIGR